MAAKKSDAWAGLFLLLLTLSQWGSLLFLVPAGIYFAAAGGGYVGGTYVPDYPGEYMILSGLIGFFWWGGVKRVVGAIFEIEKRLPPAL